MEITPLGDSALLIRVAENFDDAPDAALSKVLAAKRGLEAAQIPGLIEIAPAYTTVALFYNPVHAIDAGAMFRAKKSRPARSRSVERKLEFIRSNRPVAGT